MFCFVFALPHGHNKSSRSERERDQYKELNGCQAPQQFHIVHDSWMNLALVLEHFFIHTVVPYASALKEGSTVFSPCFNFGTLGFLRSPLLSLQVYSQIAGRDRFGSIPPLT